MPIHHHDDHPAGPARDASGDGSGDAALRGAPTDALDWDYRAPQVIDVYLPDRDHRVVEQGWSFANSSYTARALTTWEREAAQRAFAEFTAVTELRVRYVDDPVGADFALWVSTDDLGPLGYWYIGGGRIAVDGRATVLDGWGWLDRTASAWDAPGLARGGDGYATLVHEIAHGLGLAHPHDRGGGSEVLGGVSSSFGDLGAFDLNQQVHTIMSYNRGWDGPLGPVARDEFGGAAGPMALDIAYLQDVYGANMRTATGDDRYVLDATNGRGTWYDAIWDAGGHDRIVVGDVRLDAHIDLRAATLAYEAGGGGFVSHHEGIAGGLLIAAGVTIEDAVGGRGDDMLRGNVAANGLVGHAGRDTLYGMGGRDMLNGGAGADVLSGGGGADHLSGEDGDDRMFGGGGDDVLMGGRGADTFVFGRDWGRDDIRGFAPHFDVLRFRADSGVDGMDDLEIAMRGADVHLASGEGEVILRGAAARFEAVEFVFV